MKIGILTWYEVVNYGSFFQTYALQEYIKSLGHTVEVLRNDRIIQDPYKVNSAYAGGKRWFSWLRNQTPNRRNNRKYARKKTDVFMAFQKQYLNCGAHFSETDADRVLIGSDQIFDVKEFYYPFQFGAGISCDRISTYAPSFGETTLEQLKTNGNYSEIAQSIQKLGVVNGRDQNTLNILEYIRHQPVDAVLDPTLLYHFEKEKCLWSRCLIDEKYCVVYTWGGYSTSEAFSQKCRQFASENHLKLVSVGEIRKWCDIQYAAASPIDYFQLFMHADMVLTNMFHGTCFSIIMEKPFYSFIMPHNKNKLAGLLSYLNLESQAIHSIDKMPLSIPSINYQGLERVLSQYRARSHKSLLEALA